MDVINELKKENISIISVEQTEGSTFLNEFSPNINKTYAVVFGNEVKGVSQQVVDASDIVIEIPQFGTKHSLNISVSLGVVIWDLYNKINS